MLRATLVNVAINRQPGETQGPLSDLKYLDRNALPILSGKVPNTAQKKLPGKIAQKFAPCIISLKVFLVAGRPAKTS